jgi:hypothetical protein
VHVFGVRDAGFEAWLVALAALAFIVLSAIAYSVGGGRWG